MNNLWHLCSDSDLKLTQPLAHDTEADTVIIGGGFTGMSAALHLAEAGRNVCVLEANHIGHGGSGRNVGYANAGLWTPPDEVEEILGKEKGRALNTALAAGPDIVFGLIEQHGIDCHGVRNGTLHCAPDTKGLRDLRNRFDQQKKRGAPVKLLSAEETAARTGTDAYIASLFDRRAGVIHPLRYVRGLARAAIKAGAQIHEGSPALSWTREGDQWVVRTQGGTVRASRLIEATNGYSTKGSENRYTPFYYFNCATAPLPADTPILQGGEGVWDTATAMSSFRRDKEGRLVIGAVGKLEGLGNKAHVSWARRKLKRLFPALANEPFENFWHGRIAMTGDHLPKVVETGPDSIAIFGYSGRGICPGTVFGKAAAAWAMGGDNAFPLDPVPHYSESMTALRSRYYETGARLIHLLSERI